jgi:hypothetical protein
VSAASDDELLEFLKIRASPSEVDIYRHPRGFVVLRRDSQGLGASGALRAPRRSRWPVR